MKVIVSHDVDHLFILEHWKDRFILGLIYKSLRELLAGKLSITQVLQRFRLRQHRIPELVDFNSSHGIPSNFFFGMSNGLSLSYSASKAAPIIKELKDQNFFVGTHGIAFEDELKMRDERDRMNSILESNVIGIRNHYLRQAELTKRIMTDLGYQFDSTDRGLVNPKRIGKLWSIPISVMDVDVVRAGRLEQGIWNETMEILEKAIELDIEYFVINFHDIYFDKVSYPIHYSWYVNLINHCRSLNLEFISFNQAINELNNN